MFKCRLGPDPHTGGLDTPGISGCPDIWELKNGDYAIIGRNATSELTPHLPETASCGPDESIVVIPRSTLVNAKTFIPPKLTS